MADPNETINQAVPGAEANPPFITWEQINALAAGIPPEQAEGMTPDELERAAAIAVEYGDLFLGS